LVETHLDLKSRSVVKINICTLTSVANVRILDERRPTREKCKGDEVLCMTKLDALRIPNDGHSRNASCPLIYISTFLLVLFIDFSINIKSFETRLTINYCFVILSQSFVMR